MRFDKFFCYLGMIIRQYKHLWMLIAFWVSNNITGYSLLTACCELLLDYYCYQITNNFEKLLKQKDAKNISKVATPILLTIDMHIGPTRI